MSSLSRRRTARTHVKSGCRTCKVRKVKCDEDRPACVRCISTGRVCDGYGIWGGGGNFYGQRKPFLDTNDRRVVLSPRQYLSIHALSSQTEDIDCFDWFKCRTSLKLPGGFVSSFWNTLLLQASHSEPAVLHAILALSSVHKRGSSFHSQGESDDVPDEQERFSLQHYGKAITHLQPHLSSKDRASFRVALITCVVFVCMDFLRGHFKTAQVHLQNGLKVIAERQMIVSGNNRNDQRRACYDPTDVWIAEVFSRLYLQVRLLRGSHQPPGPVPQARQPVSQPLVYHSTNEVWQDLERLLNRIFHLTHQGRQQEKLGYEFPEHTPTLLNDQQCIQAELMRWLDLYEACKRNRRGKRHPEETKHDQLLVAYHTMATIMADTCLHLSDELVFDSKTDHFIWLVGQLTNLKTDALVISPRNAVPARTLDMSRSIIDLGWIPPLFYAATKCRVHRVRLQAISLLESTFHREGIWDSRIAACVARKVMMAEELDFYGNIDTDDEFPLLSSPRPEDLLLPTLPDAHRLRDVEMVLSDAPVDEILLFCSQKGEGEDRRVLLSTYDVRLQRWIDRARR